MGTLIPTTTQITAIRADLSAFEANYTDDQITALWAACQAAVDALTQHDATLYLMAKREYGRLILSAVDYRTGNTEEKLSQKIANLKALMALYAPAYARITSYTRSIAIGSLRIAAPAPEEPNDDRATSQWIGPLYE